jgi:hypothetical protein
MATTGSKFCLKLLGKGIDRTGRSYSLKQSFDGYQPIFDIKISSYRWFGYVPKASCTQFIELFSLKNSIKRLFLLVFCSSNSFFN